MQFPSIPNTRLGRANAVSVCLRVQPEEKVCVITDEATLEIGGGHRSGTGEARVAAPGVGAGGSGGAAAKGFAAEILADLETSQVSIFAVWAQKNELRSRMQ